MDAAAEIEIEDSLMHPIIVSNPKAFAVERILKASVIPPHFISFKFTPSIQLE